MCQQHTALGRRFQKDEGFVFPEFILVGGEQAGRARQEVEGGWSRVSTASGKFMTEGSPRVRIGGVSVVGTHSRSERAEEPPRKEADTAPGGRLAAWGTAAALCSRREQWGQERAVAQRRLRRQKQMRTDAEVSPSRGGGRPRGACAESGHRIGAAGALEE